MKIHALTRGRVLITAAALAATMAIPQLAAGAANAAPARGVSHAASLGASQAAGRSASQTASRGATAVPHYQHIAVVLYTDHGYTNIIGNKFAPTINALAKQYGLASKYYSTSDPDVADILAMLTGKTYSANDGIPYWDQQLKVPSLLSQLAAAHLTWNEYAQSMPYPGYLGDCYPALCLTTDTLYNQVQFNSVPDLSSVASNPAQARNMVPAAELAADAKAGQLPNFSLVDPNECDNMHGGPPWCEDSPANAGQHNDNLLVSGGDSYIKQVTQEIMSGPQWKHGNNAIVITGTEGNGTAGCCDAKSDASVTATRPQAAGTAAAGAHPRPARAAAARATGTAASPWKQVTTPNVGPSDNTLEAIAGRSPTDIWAVGTQLPNANATIVRTLAIHYNGTTWSVVPTPANGPEASSLYGVAALPDGTAWAVGIHTKSTGHTTVSLAEHWNGTAWTVVPTPNPGSASNMLYGVAAVSDNDVWAVGGYAGADNAFHPLLEHWNGTSWSVVSPPGPPTQDGMLTSVTSAHSGVWAAGQLAMSAPDQQIVLHLKGSSWMPVSEPGVTTPGGAVASAYPQSIAVTSAGPWVDGNDRTGDTGFSTMVEAPGAGGKLHELSTPNPTAQDNYLYGIAPVKGGHAWAVGYDLPPSTGNASSLIEYGSATGGWKVVPSPNPASGGNNILYGALAFSPTNVWAVGTYDGTGGMRTLALHYTGG